MPIGHLALNVEDLERSRRYYGELLPTLEFERFLDDPDQFAYRPAAGKRGTYLFFYPAGVDAEQGSETAYSAHRSGLQHLAFMVRSRDDVDDVHALVQRLGSEVVHPPRDWPEYPPPYYATFWRDPDGILLEAVCHHRTRRSEP